MKKIIFISICFLSVSCSPTGKYNNYFDGEIKEYDSFLFEEDLSTADTLSLPESVMAIGGLRMIDSMLLIDKGDQKTNMTILNLNDGRISADIAFNGRGPNEYILFLTFGQYIKDPDKISLYTFNDDLSIRLLNVTDSWKKNTTVIEEEKKIDFKDVPRFHFCQGMFFLNDGSVFAKYQASYNDARDLIFFPAEYDLINAKGKKEVIPFFGKDLPSNPLMSHFMDFLYTGVTQIKPDGTKVVDGMYFMDYLNFIDLEKKSAFGMKYRDAVSYEEFKNMSREEYFERSRHSYSDLSVTDDYVFCLYQGNNSNNKDSFENMRIRIFDWNGTPLASLKPDRNVFCIAFDEKTNRLYASDLEDRIFIYDLNEIIDKISGLRLS